jgi:dienelactone hydrolase
LNRRTVLKGTGGAALLGAAWNDVRAHGDTALCEGGPMQGKLLKSADFLTTDTAEAIYGRHRIAGTWGWIRHDVNVYRITYATRDADDTKIVASGAILVPQGVDRLRTMCYCRGTIIPGSGERNAPSYYERERVKDAYDDHYEMSYLAATFAAAGYLVVAPDGIGYGATNGREHPYMHARSLAWTSLDMLRAARELAVRQGLKLDRDEGVFVTGWSEGGLCGMALHELIEGKHHAEFRVAASSLLAGTYALSAQMHLFCSYDEDYPEAQTNYWKLRSMCRVYKDDKLKGLPFERVVVPPYAEALAKDVMALAPKNPRAGLDPRFRERFLGGKETGMDDALRDNDRYNWSPQAPVFLHHGTHDDIVPFFCAQMAYEAMRAKGCRVTLYPYLGQDHYQPANTYVIRSLGDFEKIHS